MTSALLALVLGFKGYQINLLGKDDGSAPALPRYIAGRSKRIEWVFLGAGRVDLVWQDLIARHDSFMIVPWLLWPPKALQELSDVLETNSKQGQQPWDGIAVDRRQLAEIQRYLSHLESTHHTFRLVSKVDRACRVFPAPSDHEMIENFNQHQTEFKAIAKMAHSDHHLGRIDEDMGFPEESKQQGVGPARVQQYRKLFGHAAVPRGIVVRGRDTFQLIYWTYGAAPTEDYVKSYVHLPKRPKGVLKSTDGYEWDHRGLFEVYRHIEGDWYLSLSHTPN